MLGFRTMAYEPLFRRGSVPYTLVAAIFCALMGAAVARSCNGPDRVKAAEQSGSSSTASSPESRGLGGAEPGGSGSGVAAGPGPLAAPPDVPVLLPPGDIRNGPSGRIGEAVERRVEAKILGSAGPGLQPTLENLQETALAQRPDVRASRALLSASQARVLQAGLYPNPVVGYRGEEIGTGGTAGQQGGFVSWTILTARKLTRAQAVALAEVLIHRVAVARVERLVQRDVALVYVELARAAHEQKLAAELVTIARQQERGVQALFEQGLAARGDLLQARLERQRAESRLREAEVRYDAARRRLAATVGVDVQLLPAPLEIPLPSVTDRDRLWAVVEAESPDLLKAAARLALAQATLELELARRWPDVELEAAVAHDHEARDTIAGAAVAVALPVFNRNQGAVLAARAALAAADQQLRAMSLALQAQFDTLWGSYQTAYARTEALTKELIPTAVENFQIAQEAYQRGQIDFVRLLLAQRALTEVQLEAVETRAQTASAYYQLRYLTLDGAGDPAASVEP
jgi:cobalt-zinc-cadmium efflux system outer membrane protein